jgi:hypothetical protein
MPYLSEILSDHDLATALGTLAEVCAESQAELGLTPADIAEIQGAVAEFRADLQKAFAARAAARAAVEAKNSSRELAREVSSKWSRLFRANPDIPDSLLAKMNLAPHVVPGTRSAPETPFDLVARPDGNGNVLLKWNRGGNRQGTQFLIEARFARDESWQMLASTTRSTYKARFAPGRYVAFRLRAQRAGRTSYSSIPCELWGTEQAALELAA